MIKINTLITGPLGVNTYIVHDDSSNKSIIIDPAEGLRIKNYLDDNNLVCTHILLTHGHFDHILGVAYLKRETGAKVLIHEADASALSSDKVSLAAFTGSSIEKCEADTLLHDGDELNLSGIDIRVMHTPGHSKGSVCYIVESSRVIFSGDTLFRLSVGRSDLYRSNEADLQFSLLYKLYALKGDYEVFPGHERRTELEFERQHNPYTKHLIYE